MKKKGNTNDTKFLKNKLVNRIHRYMSDKKYK